MRSLTRREATLAGTLAVALLGALWLKPEAAVETAATLQASTRNSSPTPGEDPEGAAPAGATPGAPAGAAAATTGNDVPKLLLEREGVGGKIGENLRNLFNYTKSPAEFAAERAEAQRIEMLRVEAEKRRAEQQAKLLAEQLARAEQERLHPTPPPEPPPPPITMRLIGLIGPTKSKLAVLSEGPGGEVYVVKAGDVFADKFKLLTLDFESVTVGYVNPRFAKIPPRTLRIGG